MAAQQQQLLKMCVMCGGGDISTSQVTYRDGEKEDIPVCNSCGHWHFPGDNYAYLIHGLPEHVKEQLQAVLSAWMPLAHLTIEVVEMSK